MIKINSLLHVSDNSGALIVGCLNVPRLFKKRGACVGCILTSSVKKNIFKKNITKKSRIIVKSQIIKTLLVTTAFPVRRNGLFSMRCSINSVILLNQYELPYGTRLFGFLFREIRQKIRFRKIISLAILLV